MIRINNEPIDPGCYIDGHWGQYGNDRLAEIAESFGWVPKEPTDDPRVCRRLAEQSDLSNCAQCAYWDLYHESGEVLEDYLNSITDGAVWGWHDGEFYLQPIEWWEEQY